MPPSQCHGRQAILPQHGSEHGHYSVVAFNPSTIDAESYSDKDRQHFADDEADDPLPSPGRSIDSLPQYRDIEPGPPEYEHRQAGWFHRVFGLRTQRSEISLRSADIEQDFDDEDEEVGTISCPACQVEITPRCHSARSFYCASSAGVSTHREHRARRLRQAADDRATCNGTQCWLALVLMLLLCLLFFVGFVATSDADRHEKMD